MGTSEDAESFSVGLPQEKIGPGRIVSFGRLRCKRCRELRSVDWVWHGATQGTGLRLPGLATLECRECLASHPAGVFPSGRKVGQHLWTQAKIIIFDSAVSLATAKTPDSVAFYLDQAARSKGAEAMSAAAAMYRAAVEMIFFETGFKEPMLGNKLNAFEASLAAGTAPVWARDVDAEEVRALKKLGDGAIHANDGDITKQETFTAETITVIELAIAHLLDVVYERPAKAEARKKALQSAAAIVTPPKP